VWALCCLCFVACLNPMPDDFPNQSDPDLSTPESSPNDADPMAPGTPLVPGETDGPTFEDGSVVEAPEDVHSGAGGADADAGAPEADAGP